MKSRYRTPCLLALLTPIPAMAQVSLVARTADNAQDFGLKSTDAAISVGRDAIVVTSNFGISIFAKTGGAPLEAFANDDLGFPFIRVETDPTPMGGDAPSRWFDGRTEYDQVNNRQWMMYSETNGDPLSTGDDDISSLHVAVNRDPAFFTNGGTLDQFGTGQWWYFTGPSSDPGNGGTAFDLQDNDMARYPAGGPHDPFPENKPVPDFEGLSLLDLPTISIDEQALYVTAFGLSAPDPTTTSVEPFQGFYIIPLEFDDGGVTKSMLDGDKPDESLILSLRPMDLPADPAVVEYEPGAHWRHFAVQEPFDYTEARNAQLFVSVLPDNRFKQTGIRVSGLWYDEVTDPLNPRWRYTQHIEDNAGSNYPLEEVTVGTSLDFYYGGSYQTTTPDTAFNPRAVGGFPSAAVLAEDNQGDLRLFMAHHVRPAGQSGALDQVVVQWYVIDPDLDNFRVIQNPPSWNPTLIAGGRISTDGTNSGDCLHPTIGVTRQGAAYIEYTFTNDDVTDGWPHVRRVALSTDYTSVVSNTLLQAGPIRRSYEDGAVSSPPDINDPWADFADMQHDPFLCKFWTVHTLVHQPDEPDPPVGTIDVQDKRDIWLFELPYNCFTPDLNQNSMVESGDALLFDSYYATEDERADANADGEVDVYDAAAFIDAFTRGLP